MDTVLNHAPLRRAFWRRQRVLLTGHSGFIGGWMATMLSQLGASVSGFSLPPETSPALFDTLLLQHRIHSQFGDINDAAAITAAMQSCQPTLVLHLASEAIVRRAHNHPRETFATNVMGTLNVLEACRSLPQAPHIIAFTTDKVYENNETGHDFSEHDPLGGKGIYDCSKSAQDQLVRAYHYSYLRDSGIATVRAGNVIGGGDFSPDRIIPDAVRAMTANTPLALRNPAAVRPWQHVMEPVYATLLLAQKLADDPAAFSGAWNIGPAAADCVSVAELLDLFYPAMHESSRAIRADATTIPESQLLRLNTDKARQQLQWAPLTNLATAITLTARWYLEHRTHPDMHAFTVQQLLDTLPTS